VAERGLRVERWRKYGKDRLYVNDEAGQRVGWVDLLTGAETLEVPSQRDAFDAALATYRVGGENLLPAAPMPSEQTAQVEVPAAREHQPDPAWRDLAANRPGALARAQADAQLAAMRDRTKIGTFLARTFAMKTDERAWRVGAGGEETVGAKLEKLRKHGWHVIHSVPVGSRGSDIDHVVIGWGGVFTLNTKTHPGKRIWVSPRQVRVDGHSVPYLRNSRHEAERATQLLTQACGRPVFVKPALVFLTGSLVPDVTIKQRPDDVLILDRMDIPDVFKRAPRRLDQDVVETIFEVARRSTTWVT
jgi:hypothetical protein